ncbi:MAG: hypothetical protein C4522_12845 [Desulfobacteraceae bacterium]|nr:MAG: hypothetical protein C4522_12845 [Desulfobacteraceae bacterium]
MSTILKALRKIENESGRNDGIPAWPGPVHIKRQADAKLRNKRKWKRMVFGFIVLILGCSSAWMYSMQTSKPPKPADAEHLPVKMETVPEKVQARANLNGNNGGQRIAAEPGMQKSEGYSSSTIHKTVKPDLSHARSPIMAASSENREIPKVPLAENNSVQKATQRIHEKRDSRIDLQAIAWAPEPEKSFAVINNRILHEGQSFDGITITHIGKDDVSFREMGNEWRERFRIK